MERDSLAGKTALVTGSGKRLGRAIVHALARHGVNVVAHVRKSDPDALELCGEIKNLGVNAWIVEADLGNPVEYEKLIERAIEKSGTLEFLINSASVFPAGDLHTLTFDKLTNTLEINAWAPFALGRDFARHAGQGCIINLLDTRISGNDPKHADYFLSKRMLEDLTCMMALKFAPNVRVNGIAPGLILPPVGEDESYLERLAAKLPLKRHGSPRDIGRAVMFLLRSEFITGEVIYVDGGQQLLAR
jgi:hypothetical protein